MKQLLALTILLSLGMGTTAWAENCPRIQAADTALVCTETVFNDNGGTIVSGQLVVWDSADTDFNESGYPYVIRTTTADDPYTAGVMQTESCPDQTLCTIVTRGLVTVQVANSTDDTTEDTLVGATTVTGHVGDYATGANTCALGTLVSYVNGDIASDNALARVFVDVDCD